MAAQVFTADTFEFVIKLAIKLETLAIVFDSSTDCMREWVEIQHRLAAKEIVLPSLTQLDLSTSAVSISSDLMEALVHGCPRLAKLNLAPNRDPPAIACHGTSKIESTTLRTLHCSGQAKLACGCSSTLLDLFSSETLENLTGLTIDDMSELSSTHGSLYILPNLRTIRLEQNGLNASGDKLITAAPALEDLELVKDSLRNYSDLLSVIRDIPSTVKSLAVSIEAHEMIKLGQFEQDTFAQSLNGKALNKLEITCYEGHLADPEDYYFHRRLVRRSFEGANIAISIVPEF